MERRDLTLSDAFGIWLKMELSLSHHSKKPSMQTDLSEWMLSSLCFRKENVFNNPFLFSALFLDPRFRKQIIQNEEKVKEAKNTLINLWH